MKGFFYTKIVTKKISIELPEFNNSIIQLNEDWSMDENDSCTSSVDELFILVPFELPLIMSNYKDRHKNLTDDNDCEFIESFFNHLNENYLDLEGETYHFNDGCFLGF